MDFIFAKKKRNNVNHTELNYPDLKVQICHCSYPETTIESPIHPYFSVSSSLLIAQQKQRTT